MMNHILFPITYDCNLRCPGCCVLGMSSTKVDIEKNIQELSRNAGNAEWVYITGGEPFLIDSLPDVCDRLKSFGFKIGITTNGTIFRPELADHADRIGISLDGDEEYHDNYRGKGVFSRALKLFDAVKGKCETVIMSVSFKGNEEALRKLKPVVENLDPTYWQIQNDVNDPTHKVPLI